MELDSSKNTLPLFSSLNPVCLCNILKFLDTFSSARTIHPIQGTWESHSRVSSLCWEVTLTWGQRTHRLCRTSPKDAVSGSEKKSLCTAPCFNFIPFMCCWPWLCLCQSLVWSSSVDAHVASVQVKSAKAATQEYVKSIVMMIQLFESKEHETEPCGKNTEEWKWKCKTPKSPLYFVKAYDMSSASWSEWKRLKYLNCRQSLTMFTCRLIYCYYSEYDDFIRVM